MPQAFKLKSALRAAIMSSVILAGAGAATIGLAPAAMAAELINNGIYQGISDTGIVNKFTRDVFGGLEVTPYRGGVPGAVVVYKKLSTNKWVEASIFAPNPKATYELLPSGNMLWQRGSKRIELVPQSRNPAPGGGAAISGNYSLDGMPGAFNNFRMNGTTQLIITPWRNGAWGEAVSYTRVGKDLYRADNGTQTYQLLPDGRLHWKSNDGRNKSIILSPSN